MDMLNKRRGFQISRVTLLLAWFATLGVAGAATSAPRGTQCERQLVEAKRIAERNVRSERVGLWERLRDLRESCDSPEVHATLRAQAALVYQILPEYSESGPRVAMLEGIESELETLPTSTEELLEIVDLKAGSLQIAGRLREAGEAAEKSLRLREDLYGRESSEYAFGLLGIAWKYAMNPERSVSDRERALSFADEGIALALRVQNASEADRRNVLTQGEDLFRELGLSPSEIQDRLAASRVTP
jgi:hypothetical protein